MARSVVHDPKDALGANVGLYVHDLLDQTTEWLDPILGLATAEELGTVDIPSGEVGQRSATLVLVLEAHHPSGGRRSAEVLAEARLDGGLLVGANDEVALTERFALEASLIEVEPLGRLSSRSRDRGGRSSCDAARGGWHRPKATARWWRPRSKQRCPARWQFGRDLVRASGPAARRS